MFKRRMIWAMSAMLIMALLSACAPKPGETPPDMKEVQVLLLDDQIVPAELSIKPGENIRFFVSNGSTTKSHSLTAKEIGLDLLVEAEKQGSVDWLAPQQKGEYYLQSVVNGTKESGLQMKLLVEDPLEAGIKQNQLEQQMIQEPK